MAETKPSPEDAVYQSALAAQRAGKLPQAIAQYNKLLASSPDRRDALNNLGVALRQSNRFAAAETCYRRLLSVAGPNAGLCINLANCLRDQGQLEDARSFYGQALDLEGQNASAWHGLGLIERDLEKLDESIAAFDKALALDPGNEQYKWDRALSLLRAGRYGEGFAAYECRWSQPGQRKLVTDSPAWDGSPLEGRTLLLYGEQGFGDVIQFSRFIPEALDAGGIVILSVRPELISLLRTQFPDVKEVVSRESDVPPHDLSLPILSLPRVLGLELADLKSEAYFTPQSSQTLTLPPKKERSTRVALAWSGSPTQKNDRNRSFPLTTLAPLLTISNAEFYSVQKGPASAQIGESGLGFCIQDISLYLADFSVTASVLDQMDLVISCDSAVVHLAGAFGRPVWVALSVFHDWRYGVSGDLAPWYDSARVFKQSEPGDWNSVVAPMRTALMTLASSLE